MRVLIFLPCFTHGGAEKQGALLAKHLRSLGHQVEVWGFPSLSGHAPLRRELTDSDIATRELPSWPKFDWRFSSRPRSLRYPIHRYWKWPRQLAAFARTIPFAEFDAIVPFTPIPCVVSFLFPERLTARVTVWNHRGGYDSAVLPYSDLLVSQVLKLHPVFVANSTTGSRFLADQFHLELDDVQVIRNAYIRDSADAVPDRSLRGSKEPLNLVHVANVFAAKDLETVVAAVPLLQALGVPCHLHIAGFFPNNRQELELLKRVQELKVARLVTFHGPLDRLCLHGLLRRADIGLLSSRSEGSPNSVTEYMDWQLPVIATDIPGIREVVGEQNFEWLFRVGDSDGLARRIVELAADRVLRARLGQNNRRRVLEVFRPEVCLNNWISALTKSLGS